MRDLQGKDTDLLKNKKLFLFDMDGTIYEKGRLFNGSLELLNWIQQVRGKYVFITNNSSNSVKDYVNKLTKMGIKVDKNNFFTSSQATALYLLKKYKNQKIYCMGTKSFIRELKAYGVNVTNNKSDDIEVVVVGFDTELTYAKVCYTCELLFKGLPFIATNPDRACPVDFGFIPDCGAICEALFFATNRRPKYIGKPKTIMVEYAVKKSNYNKEQTVIIGDRLYTDIATGVNAGVTSICVLSGETKIEHLKNSKIQPDYVFNSVKQILEVLKNNGN